MQNDPQVAFIESARALKARIATPRVDPLTLPRLPSEPAAERRRRSLNTCHRYAQTERPRKAVPRASRAYVPELAARVEDDPNLTDGARRCARKLAELTYRQNRAGRSLPVTVTYLAKALGRCRRTVQRYLRQLEREGYVSVDVIVSQRARMCVGLVVRLLEPLLAGHHRGKWPGALGKPGATRESQNERLRLFSTLKGTPIPVEQWAMRCMDGVFGAFIETKPLAGLPPVAVT
ncbi:hypothetical protein ASD50_19260 [Mesorhizobium sp. Root552]|jgi:hypothetical protein|nr:hypothetical protein ASD50_19260 [Mesorhizobium sp. Root552]